VKEYATERRALGSRRSAVAGSTPIWTHRAGTWILRRLPDEYDSLAGYLLRTGSRRASSARRGHPILHSRRRTSAASTPVCNTPDPGDPTCLQALDTGRDPTSSDYDISGTVRAHYSYYHNGHSACRRETATTSTRPMTPAQCHDPALRAARARRLYTTRYRSRPVLPSARPAWYNPLEIRDGRCAAPPTPRTGPRHLRHPRRSRHPEPSRTAARPTTPDQWRRRWPPARTMPSGLPLPSVDARGATTIRLLRDLATWPNHLSSGLIAKYPY